MNQSINHANCNVDKMKVLTNGLHHSFVFSLQLIHCGCCYASLERQPCLLLLQLSPQIVVLCHRLCKRTLLLLLARYNV